MMAGRECTLWACKTPLSSPALWLALVARVLTPCRCLPANRLLNESFVSGGSRPWLNKEQQSHSGGKPGVLLPTAAVSSGLVALDLSKEMPGTA